MDYPSTSLRRLADGRRRRPDLAGAGPSAGRTAFAHEAPRSTASTATPSTAKDTADDVEANVEGTLEIMVEERTDGTSRSHHALVTRDGTRLALEGLSQRQDLLTGDVVRTRGRRSETAMLLKQASGPEAVSTGALTVLSATALPTTAGPQKVVVLLVNFLNDQSQPTTVSDVQARMTLANDFYRENSYQQMSLATDVFGWFTMPITKSCSTATIKTYAEQAAAAAGVNLSAYAKRVYLVPAELELSLHRPRHGGRQSCQHLDQRPRARPRPSSMSSVTPLGSITRTASTAPPRSLARHAPAMTTAMPSIRWAAARATSMRSRRPVWAGSLPAGHRRSRPSWRAGPIPLTPTNSRAPAPRRCTSLGAPPASRSSSSCAGMSAGTPT